MSLTGKDREAFEAKLEPYVGIEIGIHEVSRDPVNTAMVRKWCDALGDENPAYLDEAAAKASVHGGLVAPPTMMQAWILPGFEMAIGDDDPANKQRELHRLFDSVGYTGVVATNCEQEYVRYLRPGDSLKATTVIEGISEQKATGLGIGYFINTRTTIVDEDGKEIGWMTFRVLKYEPAQQPAADEADTGAAAMAAKPSRIKPALGHDNKWWWDGIERGEMLIQTCNDCGAQRHPPRPMCPECQSTEWGHVTASGKGEVYSFVVIHYPEVPGYTYPLVVAVIDLEEGIRITANIEGCESEKVFIGMPVLGQCEQVDETMKLPIFRPVG